MEKTQQGFETTRPNTHDIFSFEVILGKEHEVGSNNHSCSHK